MLAQTLFTLALAAGSAVAGPLTERHHHTPQLFPREVINYDAATQSHECTTHPIIYRPENGSPDHTALYLFSFDESFKGKTCMLGFKLGKEVHVTDGAEMQLFTRVGSGESACRNGSGKVEGPLSNQRLDHVADIEPVIGGKGKIIPADEGKIALVSKGPCPYNTVMQFEIAPRGDGGDYVEYNSDFEGLYVGYW